MEVKSMFTDLKSYASWWMKQSEKNKKNEFDKLHRIQQQIQQHLECSLKVEGRGGHKPVKNGVGSKNQLVKR